MPRSAVAPVVVALFCAFVSRDALAAPAPAGDQEARIRRVENGLLLPVLVQGEALSGMSLREEMARRKVPAVSIAVIDGGKIAWTRAYGVIEARSGDSATTETMFQAGSVSKPVAAMTALRQVEAGRLKLDEDVNRSLRSWHIPPSDSSKDVAVTLRMLLTHSAGLTVHGFPGYASTDSVPTLTQVLDGQRPANTPPIRVDIPPGKTFRYAGGGFCVAQQLMMDVTGESYERLVERSILRPLAMSHSSLEQPASQVPGAVRATGHSRAGLPIRGKWHRYPELAAAGLWSTPGDLARVMIEVQASYRGAARRVLSPAMTRAMLTPQITAAQGIGWRRSGEGPSARFEHSGDTEGFVCAVVGYVERGQGAVIMTNGIGGGVLLGEILRGIANVYGWPDYLPAAKQVVALTEAQMSPLVGRYVLDIASEVFVEISTSGDSLYATVIQPGGTQRGSLLAESPTQFFERDTGIELGFLPEADGRPLHLVVRQGEEEYRATRVR